MNSLVRRFVACMAFSLLFWGDAGFIFAAPQPVLENSDAERIRSLPYGLSSGPAVIIRSRHVARVMVSGAAGSSRYGFAQEGGLIPEVLWLRLHNAGSETWSNCAIEFMPQTDMARFNTLVLWVRGLEDRQRFLVTLQDGGWEDRRMPQARTIYVPPWGLPKDEIVQVVIPFASLTYNASLDFGRLSRLGFQFGRATAGNQDGNIIEILGLAFVEQPKAFPQIRYFNLAGKPISRPVPPAKPDAPEPAATPVPPVPTPPVVADDPEPPQKSDRIRFATDPTYFEPVSSRVKVYSSPSSSSKPVGYLKEGNAYLGMRSQKIGSDLWFLLELDAKTSGWVPSLDVEFAATRDQR